MGGGSPNAQRLVPCMPPLMEEETIPLDRADGGVRYGGTACENFVKAYFLSQGINIAEPYVDDGVDSERTFVKQLVQKYINDGTDENLFNEEDTSEAGV